MAKLISEIYMRSQLGTPISLLRGGGMGVGAFFFSLPRKNALEKLGLRFLRQFEVNFQMCLSLMEVNLVYEVE